MEDGFDIKGCAGEEARLGRNVWGGQLPVIWGGIIIVEKHREMGGPFALHGRCLMEGHNNQPKVGINNGRVEATGEERVGGCCLFAWSSESAKKKNDNKNISWP